MNIYDIKSSDSIVAIATASGKGAIAIVRMSGDDVLGVAQKIFKGKKLENRVMTYGYIVDDSKQIDEVMAVYLEGPKTYTGEDCVEIYCHGSTIATKNIVTLAIDNGARLAQPGEFTKRAFFNGRIDLSQAEAVADVINANTQSASDMALNQLSGRLKENVTKLMDILTKQIAHIEVTVDYPHEDIEEQTAMAALKDVETALVYVEKAISQSERGKIYRNGIRCTIIGQPNVGKSSLLNAILGESRAIVTATAGTTRDTLESHIDIAGIEVIITDTAGIRESNDDIEKIGVDRAYEAIKSSHLILLMLDASKPVDEKDLGLYNEIKDKPHLIVLNKADISSDEFTESIKGIDEIEDAIKTSALKSEGIDILENAIVKLIEGENGVTPAETELSNVRHIEAMKRAKRSLDIAKETLTSGMPVDLAVVDLRDALHALGEITGASVDEDVINSIFCDFCVGK